MMNERGEPVIMDFGLARLAGANAARLTGSGALLGTPAYMSPEQVNGDARAIGPPCDIYSLGVILYELLTGHLPFEGSVGAVLGQILTQAPKPPSASRPDLDPRLEAICLKAMQKEIVARYASMTEFAWALGETLQPASPPIAAAARAQTQRRREPADTRHETAPILATQAAAKPVPGSPTHAVAARQATLDATETARIGRRSAVAGFGAGCGIATVLGIIGLLGVAVVIAIVLWVGKAPDSGPQGIGKNGNDKDKLPLLTVEDALIREMNFRPVPKGTFWMGGGSVEAPRASQVTIANDFELAAYTVTQGQWEAVMGDGSNLSWFSRKGKGSNSVANVADVDLKRFPVEMVSWFDIQTFLEKLNERQQGKKWKYRLPKEAEWEYACRGAATTKEGCSFDFYFANGTYDLSWDQANFNSAFPVGNGKKGTILTRTAKVGQYPPNKLGLYDMHGNVWQWCEDLYDNSGSERVIRGGSWFSVGQNCRAAYRYRYVPAERFYDLGFRVARVKG
jgi:formylglycine-generating enzyme required for sulfatase activity